MQCERVVTAGDSKAIRLKGRWWGQVWWGVWGGSGLVCDWRGLGGGAREA